MTERKKNGEHSQRQSKAGTGCRECAMSRAFDCFAQETLKISQTAFLT